MIAAWIAGIWDAAVALVPLFSDYINTEREDEAWKLASTVLALLLVVLSVCAALGALLAPWYVPHIARFSPKTLHTAIEMTRWMMPSAPMIAL